MKYMMKGDCSDAGVLPGLGADMAQGRVMVS